MRPAQAQYGPHCGHVDCTLITDRTRFCFVCAIGAFCASACSFSFCNRGAVRSESVNKEVDLWQAAAIEVCNRRITRFFYWSFFLSSYFCASCSDSLVVQNTRITSSKDEVHLKG